LGEVRLGQQDFAKLAKPLYPSRTSLARTEKFFFVVSFPSNIYLAIPFV
jgi:hypothetical protein